MATGLYTALGVNGGPGTATRFRNAMGGASCVPDLKSYVDIDADEDGQPVWLTVPLSSSISPGVNNPIYLDLSGVSDAIINKMIEQASVLNMLSIHLPTGDPDGGEEIFTCPTIITRLNTRPNSSFYTGGKSFIHSHEAGESVRIHIGDGPLPPMQGQWTDSNLGRGANAGKAMFMLSIARHERKLDFTSLKSEVSVCGPTWVGGGQTLFYSKRASSPMDFSGGWNLYATMEPWSSGAAVRRRQAWTTAIANSYIDLPDYDETVVDTSNPDSPLPYYDWNALRLRYVNPIEFDSGGAITWMKPSDLADLSNLWQSIGTLGENLSNVLLDIRKAYSRLSVLTGDVPRLKWTGGRTSGWQYTYHPDTAVKAAWLANQSRSGDALAAGSIVTLGSNVGLYGGEESFLRSEGEDWSNATWNDPPEGWDFENEIWIEPGPEIFGTVARNGFTVKSDQIIQSAVLARGVFKTPRTFGAVVFACANASMYGWLSSYWEAAQPGLNKAAGAAAAGMPYPWERNTAEISTDSEDGYETVGAYTVGDLQSALSALAEPWDHWRGNDQPYLHWDPVLSAWLQLRPFYDLRVGTLFSYK